MNQLYVGLKHNVHDIRFYKTMEELGPTRKVFVSELNSQKLDLSSIDVIVAGPLTNPISILPELYNLPLIGICHAFEILGALGNAAQTSKIKSNISKCTHIICDSVYIKNLLKSKFQCEVPISILPFGCDLPLMRKDYVDHGKKIRLLCTRNWTPVHGNLIVIEALKLLCKEDILEFAIFTGDGPELSIGKREISLLNLDFPVYFEGFVDALQISNLLSRANVYVSAAESDGTSVSLMEAMAGRLIPCVSNFSGNLEIIEFGRNGFYFENNNPESLASVIRRIYALNSNERRSIAEVAGNYAELHFDWQNNKDVFKNVIKEVLIKR